MTHIVTEIDKMCDFLKALMMGTNQGCGIYDKLSAYAESDGPAPSVHMWKRCLRAVAFEDNVCMCLC